MIEESEYYKLAEKNKNNLEQDQEHRAFKFFTQLLNKQYGGTGIGLTICKKTVQNHNAFIKAKGHANEGAV